MSPSYLSQFKQDAAKLAVESKQSVAKIARNLEVNTNNVDNKVSPAEISDQ